MQIFLQALLISVSIQKGLCDCEDDVCKAPDDLESLVDKKERMQGSNVQSIESQVTAEGEIKARTHGATKHVSLEELRREKKERKEKSTGTKKGENKERKKPTQQVDVKPFLENRVKQQVHVKEEQPLYCKAKLCMNTNCNGPGCAKGCENMYCGENCDGQDCGAGCIGHFCAQNCIGKRCGAGCSGTKCAQNCIGQDCAADCKVHGCNYQAIDSIQKARNVLWNLAQEKKKLERQSTSLRNLAENSESNTEKDDNKGKRVSQEARKAVADYRAAAAAGPNEAGAVKNYEVFKSALAPEIQKDRTLLQLLKAEFGFKSSPEGEFLWPKNAAGMTSEKDKSLDDFLARLQERLNLSPEMKALEDKLHNAQEWTTRITKAIDAGVFE